MKDFPNATAIDKTLRYFRRKDQIERYYSEAEVS
jgi:hypothetical protein